MSTGNRYNSEFKADAVRLVTQEGMSKARVAKDLGISYQTLLSWVAQHEKMKIPENQKIAELEAKLRAKDKELAELQMTNDILKKAAAIFAKDNQK